MRQKLGFVVVALVVAAVWVTGFLWQRGDISIGTASAPVAPSASPSSSTSSSAAPEEETIGPDPVTPGRQSKPKVDRELLAKLRDGSLLAPEVDVVVASLNLLGSDHTGPGGNYPGYASGVTRLGMALQLLDREGVGLAGLQEVQGDQAEGLSRATGWDMWPQVGAVGRAGQNVVMWRSADWELVRPSSAAIPYFGGQVMQMPVVLLRHRESGLMTYFSTFHNPASTKRVGNQSKWRQEAARREVELVKRLRATGIPHLVTGDFNEAGSFFCRLAGDTGFTSPAGGSVSGGCQVPADLRIDQVFGDPEITWTGYAPIRDDLVRAATDHWMVVAGAKIDAGDFTAAWEPVAP